MSLYKVEYRIVLHGSHEGEAGSEAEARKKIETLAGSDPVEQLLPNNGIDFLIARSQVVVVVGEELNNVEVLSVAQTFEE